MKKMNSFLSADFAEARKFKNIIKICAGCVIGGLTSAQAATVLIPLQTCGIVPATNRNVTLTPLQALGSNTIPVMDKIQGTTDAGGNWTATLLPGVYQADVRPAWGAVGTTEFYFYVDPSNAMQDAFTNLLTGTNNTYPPNQYAYSAQASDARYASIGSIVMATLATNALQLGTIPANYLLNQSSMRWLTNQITEWWSADMVNTNDGAPITNVIGRNSNALMGNSGNYYSAYGNNGFPAIYMNNGLLTNFTVIGSQMTNAGTIIFSFRAPRANLGSGGMWLTAGVDDVGVDFAPWDLEYTFPTPEAYGLLKNDITNWPSAAPVLYPDTHTTDDSHIYAATWGNGVFQDYIDGKLQNSTSIENIAPHFPFPFSGTLCVGSDYGKFAPANFYWSELLLSTNMWSAQALDQAHFYFLSKIHRIRVLIVIAGDSVATGGSSTMGGAILDNISTNLPNVTIDTVALSGGNSTQINSQLTNWISSATAGDVKILIYWFSLNNDGSTIADLSTTTNNIFYAGLFARTNGWLTAIVNPQSNSSVDATSRPVFQSQITNIYKQYFTEIINLAGDPNFGQAGQYSNPSYFASDGIHPTNAFYAEASQCYFVPILNRLIYHSYTCTSTTAPPPTVDEPWTAQDTRSPGHFFSNNNGVWSIH